MYCQSCGAVIADESEYCSQCGEKIIESSVSSEASNAEDFDFFMSVQDGFKRTKFARLLVDLCIILISAGLWFGIMAAELINHHYKLKKGEREPFEEGEEKQWHLFD